MLSNSIAFFLLPKSSKVRESFTCGLLLYNFHLFRTDKIIVIDIETIIINRKYSFKGKLELFDFKNSPKDIKLIHSLNKEGYSD